MPRTRARPSSDPNGPRSILSARMRRARAGPICGSEAISSTGAVSRSIGGRAAAGGSARGPPRTRCPGWARLAKKPSRALMARRIESARSQCWRYASCGVRGVPGVGDCCALEWRDLSGPSAATGAPGDCAPLGEGASLRRPVALVAVAAFPLPPRPRRRSPPAAIAESTASICLARPARSPATICGPAREPRNSFHPRAVTPSAATAAMTTRARRSPGVGMRHNRSAPGGRCHRICAG
jgi:hypothetical protein